MPLSGLKQDNTVGQLYRVPGKRGNALAVAHHSTPFGSGKQLDLRAFAKAGIISHRITVRRKWIQRVRLPPLSVRGQNQGSLRQEADKITRRCHTGTNGDTTAASIAGLINTSGDIDILQVELHITFQGVHVDIAADGDKGRAAAAAFTV